MRQTKPERIPLPTLTCCRCGHEWHPRSEKMPQVCPNRRCKSPYWDMPRTRHSSVSKPLVDAPTSDTLTEGEKPPEGAKNELIERRKAGIRRLAEIGELAPDTARFLLGDKDEALKVILKQRKP